MSPVDYLNSTVFATLRPSQINGVGVFAIRDIPKETKFTDYDVWGNYSDMANRGLITMTEEEFNKILPEIRTLILDKTVMTDTITFVSPNVVQDLRSWMNHSDNPNVKDFTTIKDVKRGEELTEDFRWFGNLHPLSAEHYSFL